MATLHVRIDDRLIHGQVAVAWTNSLKADRIMIVNDEVSKDEFQKSMLKVAVPPGIKLSVLSVSEAARRIKSGKYDNEKVFMILKNPKDCLELIKSGIDIKSINVGNMSYKEGKIQVKGSISVTAEDVQCFKELLNSGIKLAARMVPDEPDKDFTEYLKEKRLI